MILLFVMTAAVAAVLVAMQLFRHRQHFKRPVVISILMAAVGMGMILDVVMLAPLAP